MANNYSLNLGLTVIPEVQDPKLFPEFNKIYNALNILASGIEAYASPSAKPSGDWTVLAPWQTVLLQNMCRMYCEYSETVAAGAVINLYNVGGVTKARKADAATPNIAHGIAPAAVTSGQFGEVYLKGMIRVSGLTAGTTYYLWNTPGTIAASPGTRKQEIGYALSSDTLFFDPDLSDTTSGTEVNVYFAQSASYGQMINIYDSGGAAYARLADGTNGYLCRGYAGQTVSAGSYGKVIVQGIYLISGLTPGSVYYLGDTAGTIQLTSGNTPQKIGVALDSTHFFFKPDLYS